MRHYSRCLPAPGRRTHPLLALGMALSLAAPMAAQGNPHPRAPEGKQRGKDTERAKGKAGERTEKGSEASHDAGAFDAESIATIRAWFRVEANLRGLPPGLAKRDELPPGLQRQLEKNGTLPPGLQRKLHPLPVELERRLPPLPEGRRRLIVGGNVILLDEPSSRVVDLIANVLS